jgi:type IV pilus assembly protein PilP
MKNQTSPIWQRFGSSFALVAIGLTCVASVAYALPEPAAGESIQKEPQAGIEQQSTPLFNYLIENRADPFVPFISDKTLPIDINEIVPVAEQLSGMQLFEPGQLNLVAIVIAENYDFAMAEDTTGMGYILKPGMKIGKRGIITAIHKNEVVIEETAFTRTHKKLTSKIVMLLKKEGEE